MLLIGDDWAEDSHDVEVQDEAGRKLAAMRLSEGVQGSAKLHELLAKHGGEALDPAAVVVGIETDRGSWVQALIASDYQVYAIKPRQVARFKERYGTSGAKSDKGDAHALADMIRIDRDQLRPVAGDSEQAGGLAGRRALAAPHAAHHRMGQVPQRPRPHRAVHLRPRLRRHPTADRGRAAGRPSPTPRSTAAASTPRGDRR
ncbi:IS110 family transposase [Streptomyces carpinensis]|uniref:Transposase n=1 Tax=Streptomyces carpinensis TaxID=66369 RepID=A0ABV1W1B7_9ACTN|nr:IS110 family transposase [Streptomyces carpinensis]